MSATIPALTESPLPQLHLPLCGVRLFSESVTNYRTRRLAGKVDMLRAWTE